MRRSNADPFGTLALWTQAFGPFLVAVHEKRLTG